jgi:hypothetical protein
VESNLKQFKMESNITAVDYDKLLTIFLSKDDFRPAFKQANTVGEFTYATDTNAMIIIPNSLINSAYPAHEKVPDYQSVIEQFKACSPIGFKDTDLFKALGATPKDYDEKECFKCEGDGHCFHCDAECSTCNGSGMVEDRSAPMVYSERATIQIGDQFFTPYQLGKLEKVLIETMTERFELTGLSEAGAKFKVGEMEVFICRYALELRDGGNEFPNIVLNPIKQ